MILTVSLILHRFAANVVHFAWPLAQFPQVHLIKKNKIYTQSSPVSQGTYGCFRDVEELQLERSIRP